MRRFLTIGLALGLFLALAAPVTAHDPPPGPVGPPAGVFYAEGVAYQSVVTPAHVPDRGQFDTLYVFPDCPECAPVSDAAPGVGRYNGGRWKMIEASGIAEQLTNAAAVVDYPDVVLTDTGHRFVCPLIRTR